MGSTGTTDVPPPPPEGVEVFAKTARRLEYKFIVPKNLADPIRAAMSPFVQLDKFSSRRPDGQYTVRSIYYDNRRFSCYDEKLEGFRLKKKLRIRGYNEPAPDATVFLELKRKRHDYIDKSRAPFPWQQVQSVFSGYGPVSASLPFRPDSPQAIAAGRFLYNYYRKRMLPSALITYEREAYFGRFDPTLRITFDKNVRSRIYPSLGSLYDDHDTRFLLPGHVIFEVKFHRGLPRWLNVLTTRFGLERTAASKYARGIDAHRVEKKFLRGVAHTVEFPETPGPLESRREQKWVEGVLFAAATARPAPDDEDSRQ